MTSLFKTLLVIFLLCVVVRLFVGEPCAVSSGSMSPMLDPGDWLWIDKVSYGASIPRRWADIPLVNVFTWVAPLRKADEAHDWGYRRLRGFASPKVGDVIVFANPDDGTTALVKRIHSVLPEGTVLDLADDGDGKFKSLVERNGNLADTVEGMPNATWRLRQPFYYVLGDNYTNSMDSRVFGYIPESSIEGRVSTVLFSTRNFSRVLRRVQ